MRGRGVLGMEKTLSRIRNLRARRKLSLPASPSPGHFSARGAEARSGSEDDLVEWSVRIRALIPDLQPRADRDEGGGGGGAASAGGSGDPGTEEAWPSPSWAAARAKADVAASPQTKSLTAIGAKMGGCNEDKVFQDCLQDLQNNNNVMVILRGLPGSGKSTMAKRYEMSVMCGVTITNCLKFILL